VGKENNDNTLKCRKYNLSGKITRMGVVSAEEYKIGGANDTKFINHIATKMRQND